MTNAELIVKIKAEIERLKAKYRKDMYKSNHEGLASGYKIEAYNELLSFLSTLESEKPMNLDLENEIERLVNFLEGHLANGEILKSSGIVKLARHFYELGETRMKEQMMKDAVDAIVEDWNPDPEPEITIPLNPEEFTCGDKVRIIIIKDDGKSD